MSNPLATDPRTGGDCGGNDLRTRSNLCADYIPFSTRDKVSGAIADPGLYFERFRSEDGMIEALSHWQARAALEAMMRQAAKSPMFARYIAERQSEGGGQ